MTRIDDDVALFLDNQDSLYEKNVNTIAPKRVARDILGRLSKDSTIYILREEIFEKKISVGIVDLNLRNNLGKIAIEFQRDQNGNKSVRLNGKEVSLEDFHEIDWLNAGWKREPFIHYETLTAQEIKN